MKITFFESPAVDESILKGSFSDCEVSFCKEKLNKDNISKAKDCEIISVFINSLLDKEALSLLPNLKFIITRSTGFEHIDLEYCAQKGIVVSNVPAYGAHTVAEFAFALMLNLSRNVLKANNYIRETNDFNFSKSFEGFDLNEKTIGVVGTGRIGKNLIKMARGFNMKVIATDPHPDLAFANENNVVYKTLEEVVSEADIITLHTPYTKENYHLINKDNISKMKKGVLLINTARGALVDTEALISGIKNGIIAGAGLDVLEGERDLKIENEIFNTDNKEKVDYKILVEDHLLMEMQNVIVTPHIAFYSKEAEGDILKTTIENIKGFISGNPQNVIK
ncbi:MAG: NAD(P)-dependent oxidoreductase [Minisyncoccia bacterium]